MSDDLINYSPPTSPFDSAHATVPTEIILASPWRRIVAVTINYAIALTPYTIILFLAIFIVPYVQHNHGHNLFVVIFGDYHEEIIYSYFAIIGFIQIKAITKTGQSIGKKIMGIKVVQADGGQASFARIVLRREVLFQVYISIPCWILSLFSPLWESWIEYDLSEIVIVLMVITLTTMLFFKKNQRRTLQDMLAKTLVIKV